MTRITWAASGQKRWETGVDRGVVYIRDSGGVYGTGYAWPGLTTVTESPSGAESNKQYADNGVYANLISAEQFAATIEAFTYPSQFEQCDGTADLVPGVKLSQQVRKTFGFAYRNIIGDDVSGDAKGYKIHIIYGALAAPSEVAHATVNDSPELSAFSWEVSTTPVDVVGFRPTAHVMVDSTVVSLAAITALEDILYGVNAGADPRLPLPAEIATIIGAGTAVNMNLQANQPSFVNATGIVTLPAVTGVQWKVNGVNKTAGAQPALAVGETADIDATALPTYFLTGDTEWAFKRV